MLYLLQRVNFLEFGYIADEPWFWRLRVNDVDKS